MLLREILHVDMDAFFVSVEELENPSLKGKPVVVGADPDGRGVVAAASYEARKYGVHSAMPIRTAKRLCPDAIFLGGHYEKYREYSNKIHALFGEFTPAVEMVSIDEAYLDLTGCDRLHGGAFRAAHRLIRAVAERTGLACSVGVSTSHVVAKIASDLAKPHGLLYVMPDYEAQFLAPLPVRRMPGIGKVTEPELASLGIFRIGDIRAFGLERLKERLGKLAELVGVRLREHGFFARTVGLKLRTADFTTLTRDRTLDEPTRLDSVIFENVRELFDRSWNRKLKIRLLGVRASNLERASFQLGLLASDRTAKLTKALEAADRLRKRFGFDTVRLARALSPPDEASSRPRRRFFGREK